MAVEDLAQKMFQYQMLFEEQAAILRKDLAVYQKAYDNVSRSEGVAKDGQHWMPKADQKVAYMQHLENICKSDPKTPDDRMKICFAAHAFLACFVLFDMAQLSPNDRLQVIKRTTDLHKAELSAISPPRFFVPEPDLPVLQNRTPVRSHKVTDTELQTFVKNPLDIFGKQFILKEEDEKDGLLYEVVKARASKANGNFYGVQYADCVSAVEMDSDEMMKHLQDSFLIDE